MTTMDPSHDVLRQERPSLDAIFRPKTVALIGATETAGSVGRTLLWNLVSNPFGGTVFPVNPKRAGVLGIKAYPDIRSVPAQVDLAVIATPAPGIPGIMEECAAAGVKGAIVISAGFKELGAPGIELETKLAAAAHRGKMRVIGPNCLGIMNPLTGLNASFAKGMARPGNVAFLSQSGALCTAVLDWSFKEQVGFSAFCSLGSMLDVGFGDLIDYFGNDPKTNAILIYMESIGDARRFLSAAREVSLNKPVIVIKAGRTEAAAKAAASHTGSLAGSDDVLNAAFRRTGVLRVQNIADLFYMAEVLAKQPRPRGPRLTIVTNAGGPGVLATDALVLNGGELTTLSTDTVEELNGFLPVHWSHGNPVDVLGDAGAERYAKALDVVARDPNSDGMLVVLTPQDMTDPTATAEALRKHAHVEGKPVLASWMGGPDVVAGETILNHANIPTFPYPDTAAKAFCYMWRYAYNLKGIYETPTMWEDADVKIECEAAERVVAAARDEGRTLLTEEESKRVLAAYGIPTVQTHLAETAVDAARVAGRIGYPVVLKLNSKTVTHKTDVGGVKLNLGDAAGVERAFAEIREGVTAAHGEGHFQGVTVQPMMVHGDAYEVIVGSSVDPQFGPVMLFGSGGQLVEVYKDRALGLPPLNATLARRMMEQTKIYSAFKGVRGRKPVDVARLEQILVRFSQMILEQRWIKEVDINPLLVGPTRIVALDARVVVYGRDVKEESLPSPAIRPYPVKYVTEATLDDGKAVRIRPIRPEDEPAIARFHERLSERSVRQRYFASIKLLQRTAHDRLSRVCFNDYDREMALVAEHAGEIVAVGRLSKYPLANEAEFALLVIDDWQGKGLGGRLLRMLVQVGRDEKLDRIWADVLRENAEMQKLCERAGFTLRRDPQDPTVRAELRLA